MLKKLEASCQKLLHEQINTINAQHQNEAQTIKEDR